MLTCSFCKYTTNKKFNLDRHETNKHSIEIINKISNLKSIENVVPNEENVVPNEENVVPNEENVVPNEENVVSNNLMCKKCNKIYKTKKYLINHEEKCNNLDNLTCPRCMVTFADRKTKSKHIKRNTCKHRSIFCANTPNIQNINTQINNNGNYTNIENQKNNNTTQYIINNYGNERLDYINYDKYLEIFKKCYDIPSALTKEIHFNNEFPENINIKDNNIITALIKKDNKYLIKDLEQLVDELIINKSRLINKFAVNNKKDICNDLDIELYNDIIDIIIKYLVKEPKLQYKKQVKKIIEMIKNNYNYSIDSNANNFVNKLIIPKYKSSDASI